MRSGWRSHDHHLVFDGGPIAAGLYASDIPSAVHGHADMLSFDLSVYGVPLVVDSGFFTYTGDPAWHRHFREVAAHNTVAIEGTSQAKFTGVMGWSCARPPLSFDWHQASEYETVEGSHSSFYPLGDAIRHRRLIFSNRGEYWVIFDRLEGTGTHEVAAYFHLAPMTDVAMAGTRVTCSHKENHVGLLIELPKQPAFSAQLHDGGNRPDEGWEAPTYGTRTRAPVIRFGGHVSLPCEMAFLCLPVKDDDEVDLPAVTSTACGHVQSCEVTTSQWTDRVDCDWSLEKSRHDGRIRYSRVKRRMGRPLAGSELIHTSGAPR
jgi:hypothetical protein